MPWGLPSRLSASIRPSRVRATPKPPNRLGIAVLTGIRMKTDSQSGAESGDHAHTTSAARTFVVPLVNLSATAVGSGARPHVVEGFQ